MNLRDRAKRAARDAASAKEAKSQAGAAAKQLRSERILTEWEPRLHAAIYKWADSVDARVTKIGKCSLELTLGAGGRELTDSTIPRESIRCQFKSDRLWFYAEIQTDGRFHVALNDGSSEAVAVYTVADIGEALLLRRAKYKNLREAAIAASSLSYMVIAYVISIFSALNQLLAISLAALGILSSLILAASRFTPLGKSETIRSGNIDWSGTVALALLLMGLSTAGFTAASIALYKAGLVSFAGGTLRGIQLTNAVYGSYLWHLLAAIPLLQVPETLNWVLMHPATGHTQGALVLAYTVTVILPIIYIGTLLLQKWLGYPKN